MASLAGGGGISITGDVQLMKALDDMPRKLHRKVMRDAMNKGAGIVKTDAARRAPRGETGLLAKSMVVKTVRPRGKGLTVRVIGPKDKLFLFKRKRLKINRKGERGKNHGKLTNVTAKSLQAGKHQGSQITRVNPGKYGHLVEFGRKPVVAKGRILISHTDGTIFGKRVSGVAARPFMRPAFDSKKGQVLKVIKDKIWKGIVAESKKTVKK